MRPEQLFNASTVTVTTEVIDDGIIKQSVLQGSHVTSNLHTLSMTVVDTQEQQIRDSLIVLGWIPPNTIENPYKRYKHCPNCSELLVHANLGNGTVDTYCEDCGWPNEEREEYEPVCQLCSNPEASCSCSKASW